MDRGTSGAARGAPERHGEGEHGGRGCALLERADPPRSPRRTPLHRIVAALAWDLRVGGPWRALPGGFPPRRTRLRLVLMLAGGWRFRCLDAGDRPPAPSVGGPARGAAPVHHRYAGGQVHQRARAARYDAGKGVWGRKRVALVDAAGHWLAVAVVPASVQDRDALAVLDRGKAMWPSLREAVYDGAFTAERCRTWSNWYGMRHRIVERDPAAKGFVVVARRWVVERSFGWLAHWNGLAAIAPDASMSPLGASPSSPSSPASRL